MKILGLRMQLSIKMCSEEQTAIALIKHNRVIVSGSSSNAP